MAQYTTENAYNLIVMNAPPTYIIPEDNSPTSASNPVREGRHQAGIAIANRGAGRGVLDEACACSAHA